ncbi:MAG: hydroxyacylglutathione hydrolase [Mycobacterium sp.]|nr:hydroxyacylglutathione hydrolase [Mycobacterium sp.]
MRCWPGDSAGAPRRAWVSNDELGYPVRHEKTPESGGSGVNVTQAVEVAVIETSGLGDRSYVVSSRGVAVVIDPQRDIDRVLDLATELDASITHVLETHLHNDYVSGGLALSRTTGAEYVVPEGDELGYPARRVRDGDVIDAGAFTLRALHTPGHTEHHTSYALSDGDGQTVGVFSGGSMLFDATGRTDLVGPEHTHSLTVAQYRSVRRLADEVPGAAALFPTHGFGSFCAAGSAGRDSSTIDEQRDSNPALTQDEQQFVDELLANLSEYPAYYAHMADINADGPADVDLSVPEPVDTDELRRRIEAGEWVVDLRNRKAFAAGHLRGSLGFELSDSFVTYLGWLYRGGSPLTLIGDDDNQIADAIRELVRIGIDDVGGSAAIAQHRWSGFDELASYPVADFAALARQQDRVGLRVLDVRRADEFSTEHVTGAVNIPVHELLDRLSDLDGEQIWVHCASGYRASVGAALLDSAGKLVLLVDDTFGNAVKLGLTS